MKALRRLVTAVSGGARSRPLRTRWLLLGSVVLALGLIVVASVVLDLRTSQLRDRVETSVEPVNDLVDSIEFRLARQMALLRGYALSADRGFLDRYGASRAEEEEDWSRLVQRAGELGPEIHEFVLRVRESALRWHAVVEPRGPRLGPAPPEEAAVLLETQLYDSLLNELAELSSAVDAFRDSLIAAMQVAEDVHSVAALLLSLLAVAAAGGATWLIGRTQELATEAERRREETERLTQSRVRLMRGLTHDVKNPLSAASAFAQLLEIQAAPRLAAEQRDWLRRIDAALSSATSILDDLLELSRAEAGQIELNPEPIPVDELVRDVAADEVTQFDVAGVRLGIDAPDSLPPAMADRRRVRQIVGNLLSNARKYTPRDGQVTVRVAVRSDPVAPGPGPWLSVEVSDTGPGIPADKRQSIFDEFTRLEPGAAPGLGLGLPISLRLALLMGGGLTVASEPGAGATFTLWLPIAEPAVTSGDAASPDSLGRKLAR